MLSLEPDCRACAALCCVFFSFDASGSFSFTKEAGVRCIHLTHDSRCSVYQERASLGLGGCISYQCYGAGQHATQRLKRSSYSDTEQAALFYALRSLHELLWLLSEARQMCHSVTLQSQMSAEILCLEEIISRETRELFLVDISAYEGRAYKLLRALGAALIHAGLKRGVGS